MRYFTLFLGYFILGLLLTSTSLAGQFDKQKVLKGKKIFFQKCSPCHGMEGEGIIGPAIGCHGVKNKTDQFIYETIYKGRRGNHGIDMPSWGIGDFVDSEEARKFRRVLEESKKYKSNEISKYSEKLFGNENSMFGNEKKGQDLVNQIGPMNSNDIYNVMSYIRYLEKYQEITNPSECIAKQNFVFKGDIKKGKEIFINICSKCHGEDGKGDSFFEGKGVRPRDFTDKLYMKSKSDAYLQGVIKTGGLNQGRSATMAPVSLGLKELANVITYIRTLSE